MVEAEGRTFAFDGVEALRPELLETFPYEYAGRDAVVEISTDEWSCVCPFSGLPDFGTLTVRYLPAEVCIVIDVDGGALASRRGEQRQRQRQSRFHKKVCPHA